MKLVVCVVLGGCSTTMHVPANHPAHPQAPIGRIAPAPPSLRANVVAYPDVPRDPPKQQHHHHHHP